MSLTYKDAGVDKKAGRNKAQALQTEISALQTLYKRQEDI